ncbi:MAG: hypothetical protein RL477_1112 [Pseudomonadota bacterium]|jgi:hypothetical protein
MAETKSPTAQQGGKPVELSAEQAAQVVLPAAMALQRNWLSAAVNIAGLIKAGRPVNPGTFEDLRHLREQAEEMERARIALQNLDAAQKKRKAAAAKSN